MQVLVCNNRCKNTILITHLNAHFHLRFSFIFRLYCFIDCDYDFFYGILSLESPKKLCIHLDWRCTGAAVGILLDPAETGRHIPGIGLLDQIYYKKVVIFCSQNAIRANTSDFKVSNL